MALPSILAALLNRFSASPMPTYGAEQRENEPKSWLRSWFLRHRSPDLPSISTRRPLRPLGISRLEDRRVLSVSATVAVGSDLLTITGDGDADTVNILTDGTTLQLQDENGVIIQIDGNDDILLADIANGINIDLGDGNDVLNLPVIAGLSVTVVDGLGADTISLTGSDSVVGASFNGEAEVIQLEGDLNFTAGIALTGDVTLQDSTSIDTGAASSIDGTLQGLVGTENFTLNAPGANWSFTGVVSQLGTFQITSAADVTFDSSVTVTTFTQQAGTGTTTFDALTADTISITTSDLVLNGTVEASVDALDITVDTIEVGDTITADAGINLQTATATQAIELGGATDTGTNFTLTEAELQFLSSTGVVTIGSASYTGDMTLNALDISGETYDLKLEGGAGSTVSVDGALTLGANDFHIDPPSDVTINSAITATGAGSVTIEAINEILFENSGSITTDAGTITLTSDNLITFAQSGAAVLTTSGGAINVTSDADDNATGETRINANSIFSTGAGAGNIILTGDVTSGTPDTFNLTLTAGAGNLSVTDAVSQLDTLTVTSAADVTFDSSVTVTTFTQQAGTGTTTFDALTADTISVTTSDLVLTGAVEASVNALDITVDTIEVGDTVTADAGINLQTATSTQAIELGGATDTGTNFTLTEAELQFLSSTGVVTIGSASYTGNMTLDALDISGETYDLKLEGGAGSTVSVDGALALGANDFHIDPPSDVTINSAITAAGAGSVTIEAINEILFENSGSITTDAGTITLTSDNLITFAQSGAAVLTTSGGAINVNSDADDNATGETRINANSTFTTGAGAGNITLTGDVISSTPDTFNLTLTAGAGNVVFTDSVGDLNQLQVTSAGSVDMQGTVDGVGTIDLTSSGFVDFDNTVGDVTTLMVDAGGNVNFRDTVDQVTTLTANATGVTRFDGDLSNIGTLTTDAAGSTVINTAALGVTDATFNDAVTIEQNLVITAGNDLTFNAVVSGDAGSESLTVNASNDLTFGSTVDGLASLTANVTGVTRFDGDLSNIGTVTTDAAGSTVINTAAIGVTDATFNDAVTIEQNLVITSGNDVTFDAAVSGDVGSETLTVNASNDLTFGSTVDDLASLTANVTGVTRFDGDLSSIGTLATDAAGSTVINAASIGVTDATFNDAVTIEQNLVITAGNDVTFDAAVSGDAGTETLTVNAGGDLTFGSTLDDLASLAANVTGVTRFDGNVTNIATLTTDAAGTTVINTAAIGVTDATFNDAVTIEQNIVITAGNDVNFSADVSGGAGTETLTVNVGNDLTFGSTVDDLASLTANVTGVTRFDGDLSNIGTLTTDAAGSTVINTAAIGVTDATFNDAVTIEQNLVITAGNDVAFSAAVSGDAGTETLTVIAGNDLTFGSTVDNLVSLTANVTGVTRFDGDLSNIGTLTTDAAGSTVINTASLGVTDATFNDAVTIEQNLVITAGNDVSFNAAFSGDAGTETLTVNAGNDLTFGSTVDDLASLAANVTGVTRFDGDLSNIGTLTTDAAGSTVINTSAIAVTDATFNDAVTIEQNLVITAGNDVTFEAAVNGIAGTETLTVNAGNDLTFVSTVDDLASLTANVTGVTRFDGALSNIGTLTTDAAGSTVINAAAIGVTDATFNDAVTIEQNLVVTAGNDVSFNVAVSGDVGTETLTVNAGNDLTFGSTVDDLASLAANVTGVTRFDGDLSNIGTLTTDAAGTTAINTAAIGVATVTFGDNVTLEAGVAITATSDVEFAGSVAGQIGTEILTIGTSGSLGVTGVVSQLGTFQITSAADVTFDSSVTVTTFTQQAGTGTTSFDALTADTISIATSDLVLNGAVEASVDALDITVDTIEVGDTVTADAGINLQTATSTQAIELGGATDTGTNFTLTEAELQFLSSTGVVTIGSASYTGDMTLNALDISSETYDLKLEGGAGSTVSVDGALTLGANDFHIDPPSDVTINSAITTAGAGSVTIEAINEILFENSGSITTDAGTITLTSDNLITFAQSGAAVLTTSGGAINVTSDADDNATGETRINANSIFTTGAGAGNITLTGDVTSSTPDTFNLTLTAGAGNLSVTDAVSQLNTLTVTSAADVTFDSAVTVTTFTQQAGTGTTTFDALTADTISITTSDLVLNGAVEASVDALDITVDTIEVGDTVTADAGINLQTATSTQTIELGGATDTGTNFTLTEAELQFLSSTGVVTIGSASYTGDMTLNALDISSETYDLKLEGGAGSTVSVDGGLTLGGSDFHIDPPSDVTINSAITATGAGSVTIEAINEILFENSGSITTDAGTITLTSDNLITFAQSGAAVLTTSGGAINVTSDADDNVTGETRINANSTFSTGAGAGNITLTGDVTSGTPDTFNLTLTAGAGNVVFTDSVGDLNQLQVTSAGSVDMQGAVDGVGTIDLTSSGFVDFDSAVSDVTTLTVDAGGNVNFRDTVDQVTTLTANATGVTRFDGDLSNIGTLTTDAVGSTVINTAAIGVTDATFNDAVTIEQNLVITAGNDVIFNAAVSGDAGTETLTVNAGNDLAFGSTVDDLASLAANVTGVTRFDGALSNIGTLTTDAAGSTVINAAAIGVTDATFNDAVTIEQNLVITAGNDVTFDAAVGGDAGTETLTVNAGGDLTFGSTVDDLASLTANVTGVTRFDGDLSNIGTLTTDAAGTTVINTAAIGVTDATFNDAVTIEQNFVLTAGNDVTFNAAVSGDVGSETLTVIAANNLTFGSTVDDFALLTANVTGVTRFDGDLSNIGTLTTDAAGTTVINTAALGVTDATFNDAVTIEQNLIITAGNDVAFNAAVSGDVGTETLTVNAGNDLTFGSTVDDLASLTANVTGVTRFDGDLSNIGTLTTDVAGSTVINTSAIGVTDATFNDAVTIEQNLVITAGNDVTFDAAVSGDAGTETLTVNAANDLTFGSTVDDLTSLTANVTGVTRFDGDLSNIGTLTTDAAGTTAINTAAIGVTDATFNDAVTVEQSLVITAGNDVIFNAAVSGDVGSETLTVNASNDLTFGSTVDDLASLTANVTGVTRFDGDLSSIGTLATDAAGSTVINAAAIGVTDATFNDAVTTEQNLVITAGNDVTFEAAVSGDVGSETLTVNASNDLTFGSTVDDLASLTANVTGVTRFDGDLSSIGTLATDAAGSTVINAAAIGVTDATFNDAVTIEQNLVITSGNDVIFNAAVSGDVGTETLTVTAGNDLTFGSTVDDLASLTANVTGVTRFDGDLSNIGTLTTDAAGSTVINTAAVSVGSATFNDGVQLEQDLALTATGDVTFGGTLMGVAGTESLTVVDVDALLFSGAISQLQDLTIQNAASVTFGSTVDLSGVLQQLNGSGTFIIDGAVTAAGIEIQSDSIEVRADVTATGDVVELLADDELIIDATIDSRPAGASGAVTLTAGTLIDVTASGEVLAEAAVALTSDNGLGNGEIRMADGSQLVSEASQVSMTAHGNVEVSRVESGSSADDAIQVVSSTGAILDGGDSDRDLITSGGVVLEAATGIGSGNELETAVARLDVTNGAFGNVELSDVDSVQVLQVQQAGNGEVRVTAEAGTLLVSGGSGISTVGGDVFLTAAGEDLDVATAIQTAGGSVQFTAVTGITTRDAGTIDTSAGVGANGGDVTMTVTGTGDLNLETSVNSSGGANGAGAGGDGGNVVLVANDGDVIVDNVTADGGTGTTDGGAAGDISITADEDVILQGSLQALGGAGVTDGADGLVTLGAGNAILDGNDGATTIRAGRFHATAGLQIGEIDQFDIASGNAIDLELTGSLARAEVTQAGGEIHLRQTGDLVVETGALIPGAGVAADAVVIATGDLDLGTNAGAVLLSNGDRLNVQAGDVLVLPDAGLNTGTGELRLSGVTDIVDASGRNLGTLTAADLYFNSGGAGGDTVLTTDVDRLHTEVTTDGSGLQVVEADGIELVDVLTNNGNVTIEAAQTSAGDITVDRVRAGTGGVVFDNTANGGAIVDGDETFTDVEAESLAIRTTGGVADGDRLEVAVDRFAATTVQGDINLVDLSGGLQVTTVSGVAGLQITAGGVGDNIDVRAASSLDVLSNVVNSGGGNILLAAFTAGGDGQLTISADVSTIGGSGNIELVAADDLLVDNGAEVSASQLGSVLISAGENRPVDAPLGNGSADAHVTLEDGTRVASEEGDITLRAPGDIFVSTVTADGDSDNVKGNVTLIADFDGVSGGLSDGVGAVVNNSTQTAPNVDAADLQIQAATGVGAAGALQTTVDTVSIVNSTSGDVRIFEQADGGANSLIVNGVQNLQGNVVLQTADGDLIVQGDVATTAGGDVQLIAGDSLNNGGGDLQISEAVTTEEGDISLTSEAGNVELTGAAAARSSGAGDLDVSAAAGAITMADGTELTSGTGEISLTALSQVTVGRIVTQSASDQAVQIQTAGGIVDAGDAGGADIEAENGRAVLSAETGIGSGDALETAVDRFLLTNGTAGDVAIDEQTGLQIDGLTQGGAGDVTVTAAGTVNVIAGGTGISLQGGNLELNANGTTSSVILGSDVVTNGGDMRITADDSVSLGAGVQLESQNGQIEIIADDDAGRTGASGSLTMDATAGISAGTGRIELSADGNATLTNVVTSTDLVVTSFNGGIVDAGDVASFDLVANQAALQAATGIGSGNALETQFSTLAIINDGSGNIEIANDVAGTLELGSFNGLSGVQQSGSDGGAISIANTGSLLVSDSVLNAAGGGVTLTADSGLGTSDLTVNAAIAASGPNGHLTLNAERQLTLNDTGSFIDILATSITGNAGDDLFIADNVIIQSSTGAVIQSIPLLENIVTPQVLASGDASVSGDFGRLNELNFAITVDWADGTVETFQRGEATPSSFVFEHQYFGNPNPGDPAAPIPITVSIADDPNITFLVNGVEQTLDPIVSLADVPGEGLAGGMAFDLSVDVPELGGSAAVTIEAVNNRNDSSVQDQEESDTGSVTDEATISEERIVKLRIFNAAGEIVEELILTGDQALRLLNDFVGFVEERGLPAGRYQILQQEPGDQTMRVVFDLEWRQGDSEGLQDRPPTADDGTAMPMPTDQGEGSDSAEDSVKEDEGKTTEPGDDEASELNLKESSKIAPPARSEEQ